MRYFLKSGQYLGFLLSFFFFGNGQVNAKTAAGSKDLKLETLEQKISYAIGQQIGKNMREQGVTLDLGVFHTSLKSALHGEKSLMSDQQIGEANMEMRRLMRKNQDAKAEKNLKTGEDFLAKNKSKPGVKTTASKLQYKVIKEGKGAVPKDTDTVRVHYRGTFIDGTEFDSSKKRGQPSTFPVKGVIKGWQEALLLMKPGSHYKLFVPSELAYGRDPRPGIPGNSVLIFDVELIEVVQTASKAKEAKAK